MKNLLKFLSGWGGKAETPPAHPEIHVAAFGKHPGWDDHLPGIGLETETLAQLKQWLYVTGIGGQIDSGGWEKLEADKRVEGFDHTFLWRREGQLLLGRLWSSTDRKGRAKYPMVIVVESRGLSPALLLAQAGRELEQLRDRCRSVNTAMEVEAACQDSQGRLRGALLATAGGAENSGPLPLETRRSFLENPRFGDQQLGLLRILHELEDLGGGAAGGSRHLRIPAIGTQPDESLRLWLEFFRCALPRNTPVMLILRAGVDWLDVVVGEPAGPEFFCLQASPLALALSTLIPYELKPELTQRLQNLTGTFLGTPPSAPGAGDKRPPPRPGPEAGGELPAPARPPGKFPFILLVCLVGVAVALLVGGWYFSQKHPPATSPGTGSPLAATLQTPPSSPATIPVPTAVPSAPAPATAPAPIPVPASVPAPTSPGVAASQPPLNPAIKSGDSNPLFVGTSRPHPAPLDPGTNLDNAKAGDAPPPAPTNLVDSAKSLSQGQAYQAAMQDAQAAFAAKNYAAAVAAARAALASLPGEARAQDLLDQAGRMQNVQETARRAQEHFDGLLAAGQAALAQNANEAAVSNAEAALALQPESQAARTLKESARTAAQYQAAVLAGQDALKQHDPATARQQAEAALALNPTGAAALKLKADAAHSGDADQIKTLLANKKYAAALDLCNQHPDDPEVAGLAAKIKQEQLQSIDDHLEVLQVWFGLLTPDKARSAAARAPAQLQEARLLAGGELDEAQKTRWITDLGRWEAQLTALNQLDPVRAKSITLLKKTIHEHP